MPAFFLSRKKLRPRDVKWLDQGHKAQPDSGPGGSRPFQFSLFLPGQRVYETRARVHNLYAYGGMGTWLDIRTLGF